MCLAYDMGILASLIESRAVVAWLCAARPRALQNCNVPCRYHSVTVTMASTFHQHSCPCRSASFAPYRACTTTMHGRQSARETSDTYSIQNCSRDYSGGQPTARTARPPRELFSTIYCSNFFPPPPQGGYRTAMQRRCKAARRSQWGRGHRPFDAIPHNALCPPFCLSPGNITACRTVAVASAPYSTTPFCDWHCVLPGHRPELQPAELLHMN